MRILLVASGYNGLCQRAHIELALRGHEVSVEGQSQGHLRDHRAFRRAPAKGRLLSDNLEIASLTIKN
jgi:hypothetical protein